ncbi:MAG TPA: hypothetical protein VGL59_04945 [Polyangia bacterium]
MSTIIEARRRGDSAMTERLLGRYRREFPGGVFIEEALLLSIEAAAAHDRPAAEELARLYLRRFPGGRYRETVARGLRARAD